MAETKVASCNCKHAQQDTMYGKGLRLHNQTVKKQWKCTVCSNIKN